jgi:CheY-like chemotaxis protein
VGGGSASTKAPSHPGAIETARLPPDFRCLYVEDGRFLQMILPQRIFGPDGLEYDLAVDGAEAVRMLVDEKRSYGLVLMDNQMPRMSGSNATRAIRAAGYTGKIVGVTGGVRSCPERLEFDASGLDESVDKDSKGVARIREIIAEIAVELAAAAEPGVGAPA